MVDLLTIPPADLLIERIVMGLELKTVFRLWATSTKLRNLVSEYVWERLAKRDWPDVCSSIRVLGHWRQVCIDLTTLRSVRWESPVKETTSNWPSVRWGHTVTTIDSHTVLMFGGEARDGTNLSPR